MTCIIIGCAFVDEARQRCVWGDLHQIDGVYVFNAVLNPKGEAAWQYSDDFVVPEVTKQVILNETCPDFDYFERRGVIIVNRIFAKLNTAARKYLGFA